MQSIEEKLINVIKRYKIFDYNPQMKNKVLIDNLLYDLINKKLNGKKVAIWGGGWHTYHLLNALGNNCNIEYIFDKKPENTKKFRYGIKVIPPEQGIEEVDVVIISSFCSRRDIELEIINEYEDVSFIDLYDYFSQYGIVCNAEYYKWAYVSYDDIVVDRIRYQKSKDVNDLKRLIGDFIAIRDFKNAFCYIEELLQNDLEEYKRYKKFEDAVKEILNQIDCKDSIIINWIDALRYDEVDNMPFLTEIAKESVVFDNAYTQVNYTTGTMKTILNGMAYVDDKLYNRELDFLKKTKLDDYLKVHGYELKILSGHWRDNIDGYNIRVLDYYRRYGGDIIPASVLQWEAILEASNSCRKKVILIHMCAETHPVYKSPLLEKMTSIWEADTFTFFKSNKKNEMLKQVRFSQLYLDEQLDYYSKLYGDNASVVYMSDHGQFRDDKPICLEGWFHVLFMIKARNYCAQRIKQVFCLTEFINIIENIIMNRSFENCISNYSILQTDDPYSETFWRTILGSKSKDYILAYIQKRIIITPYDLYMRLKTGQEFYLRKDSDKNLIDDERYIDRIEELKEKCGDNFIDVEKEPGYEHMIDFYSKGWKYE